MTLDPELRARVIEAAHAAPSSTRAVGRRRATFGYASAVGVATTIFGLAGGIAHSAMRPWRITFAIVVGASVVAAGAATVALLQGRSMVGRPVVAIQAVVALAPAVIFAWLTMWHGSYVETHVCVGWRCLALTSTTGAVIGVTALWLKRGSMTTYVRVRGAAVGTAAGTLGGVLVDLWCPLTEGRHVLVGHVLPVVLLAVLGWLAADAVLAARAARLDVSNR